MNKYDSVFNSEETSEEGLSPEEGVAAIAIITVLSNSDASHLETDYLIDLLWETELFDDYSDDEIAEMVNRLLGIAGDEGHGALFNAAYDCLPDELLADAFAAGVMMVVDESGTIPPGPRSFLKELQHALEIEDEEAQVIVDEVIAALDEDADEEYEEEESKDTDVEGEYEQDEASQGVYESPAGNFSVPVPVEPQKGGTIEEQEGVVGFSDDFGRLLRIDYYPISAEQADKLESLGQEDYLIAFLVDNYVEQAILRNIANSKVEYREYLEDVMEGSYFIVVDMPQGSTISVQKNNEDSFRLDALRGLLAFPMDDFLYVLSCQRTFFEEEKLVSIEQEVEQLKDQLLDFLDTVEFT
jgi:hypothetical protein